MSRRDIYNQPTRYNNVFSSNTQAPSPSHGIDAPQHLTQLRRDGQSSASSSSSRPSLPLHLTQLQRDGQFSASSSSNLNSPFRLTQFQRDVNLPARHQGPSSHQPQHFSSIQSTPIRGAATTAPLTAKSHFKNAHDFSMASKQVRYEQLSLHEQKEQDAWASNYIEHAGPCVAGYDWVRAQQGYICNGGHHLTTDALVAEGKGGFYAGTLHVGWWGPYYSIADMPEHVDSWGPALQPTHEEHPTVKDCKARGVPYPEHLDPDHVSNAWRAYTQRNVQHPAQSTALALLGIRIRHGQVRYAAQHISYHDSIHGSHHHHSHAIHHNHSGSRSGSRLGNPEDCQPGLSDRYRWI